ncbi:MAG: methionine--tRNA ligase, partial [Metallosphaera sp.]
EKGKLKGGTELVLTLARETNAYLNEKAPWDKVKSDVEDASNTLFVASSAIRAIALMLYPVIPEKAKLIYDQLGLDITQERWDNAKEPLKPGHVVGKPAPVFKKLPQDFEKNLNEILEKVRKEVEKRRPTLLK